MSGLAVISVYRQYIEKISNVGFQRDHDGKGRKPALPMSSVKGLSHEIVLENRHLTRRQTHRPNP